MTRFWSSDWHASHDNIVTFADRPFWHDVPIRSAFGEGATTVPDVEAMNKALIDNTNEMVGPRDELWLIGDLAMGRFETSIQLFKKLRCRNLFMVPGNHDRCHKMHPKWRKWQPYYEAVGLTVLDSQVDTEIAGQSVKVCHFPYAFTHPSDDRYSGLRPDDEGDFLIHGHRHGDYRQCGRMIDVGVDPWAGFPVPEETIESLIVAGPNDIEAMKWGTEHPGP